MFRARKELSFCHKLWFSNPFVFATQCNRPNIFKTMNSVRLNSISLEYQRFTPSGCEVIDFRKFEFVAKTQFLYESIVEQKSRVSFLGSKLLCIDFDLRNLKKWTLTDLLQTLWGNSGERQDCS